jgi:molybdopterin molybdotransferase
LFARPALVVLAGRPAEDHTVEARLARSFTHSGDRPTYHPAVRLGERSDPLRVSPVDWAGSADLRAVAAADGFAVFPEGDQTYGAGEIVRFLPLG